MTVENISWSISTKECCRPRRGLNPWPPGLQSDGASNWATEAGCLFFVCPCGWSLRGFSDVLSCLLSGLRLSCRGRGSWLLWCVACELSVLVFFLLVSLFGYVLWLWLFQVSSTISGLWCRALLFVRTALRDRDDLKSCLEWRTLYMWREGIRNVQSTFLCWLCTCGATFYLYYQFKDIHNYIWIIIIGMSDIHNSIYGYH